MDSILSLANIKPNISKDEINTLPLTRYEGTIHLIDTDEKVKEACKKLSSERVLGFDTETRPTFKKGVVHPTALLQLADANDVYLFQLLKLKDTTPILELLSNPKQLKVGVAVRDDVKNLREEQSFSPEGFVDISAMTQKVGIINTGLRSLCGLFLDIRISKTAQVSNWAKSELSTSQIYYAATDAWVSRELFLKVESMGLEHKHGLQK